MKKVYLIQNEMWEWVVICEGKQIFNGGAFSDGRFCALEFIYSSCNCYYVS